MHSDFFKAMFTSGLQEAQVLNPSIKLTEHPVDIVKGILKFMYTGCLPGILDFKTFVELKFRVIESIRLSIIENNFPFSIPYWIELCEQLYWYHSN